MVSKYISIYFVRSNSLQRSSRGFIFNYDHSIYLLVRLIFPLCFSGVMLFNLMVYMCPSDPPRSIYICPSDLPP